MENFAKLIKRIEVAKGELGNPEVIWYRGLSNPSYKLIPSLFRFSNGKEKELNLFEKFKRALPNNSSDKNDWETLFYMQHYGIPTRLLDWSEVLGVALFFATRDLNSEESVLWLLDPVALNQYSSIENILTPEGNFVSNKDSIPADDKLSYYSLAIRKSSTYDLPLSIFGNYIDSRILAQKGCFTVHGKDIFPLDQSAPKSLRRIKISKQERIEILHFLEISDINEFSIFPGISGLAPYLKSLVDLKLNTEEVSNNIDPLPIENPLKLVIQNAVYGTSKKQSNVTRILQKQIQNGQLDIIVNNDLFGDSHEGFVKRLEVDYLLNNEPGRITVSEHGRLIL